MARRHRRHSRKAHRKAHRKSHRRHSRKQQGGGSCAAVPLQNAVFAQRGGMAPYEAGGNDLLMDKAAMVQAQSFDQIGAIQEAGRLAAAAQHGGRRRSRKAHRRQSRKSRKQQRKSRKQRGGMSPFGADEMLLPKSAYAFTGVNSQWSTEASVQPALKMGAGPQA
jgi:hypothetical protein